MKTKKVKIYPFNNRGNIEEVQTSKIGYIAQKLNTGLKLTREEKNFVTEKINTNTFFRNSVPLLGVRFDFSDFLSTYIVKQHDSVREIKGLDKTSVRACLYGRIEYIKELK